MSETRTRRSGGRSARQALRASPLADDVRPIRAGMEGGTYKPLSDADVLKIHNAALTALETIGLADAPPSGVKIHRCRCNPGRRWPHSLPSRAC